MRHWLTTLAAAFALAACATAPAPESEAANESGAVAIAPLQFTYRQLPNGLRVYSLPDANTANVAVHVWYDVGGKNDPPGRSGFAHLFEHMMFKSTRNLAAEQMPAMVQDVGGTFNGSTNPDFTNYFEVVPANYLERMLWMEAERMGSLVVNDAIFASERDVVKEEYRQGILAQPYGRLFGLYLSQASYSVHPYGRPVIGSLEDLDAATIAEVRGFHATYYRPDNAVLVVAGNFDQARLDAWVDRYLGAIARPDRPIPRVTAREPARTGPRELTVYEPNVPLPAVAVSYPAPNSLSPDQAALRVLNAVLSLGRSSRLYRTLVYEQQVATSAFSFFNPTRDPGTFSLAAILSEGKSVDEGLASLNAEIARLRDAPVTQAELDEAKNEVVTQTIQRRETAFGRAFELADSVIRYDDPAYADKLLAAIQRTTAEDVQRVARALFDDNRRIAIRYLSEAAQAGAAEDRIATAATIEAQALTIAQSDIPIRTLAPEASRLAPPDPAAPVGARIPPTAERTLANGLRVIVAPSRMLPMISADFRVASGASADPANRAGVASMTADLITKGTASRGATQIAQEIESLGAQMGAIANADSSAVSLQTRADRANEAFAIYADVIRNPVFAAEELERSRRLTLDGLTVALRQPSAIAGMAMSRAIYGTAPYGGVASPVSVRAIAREDAAAFHAAHWRPDNSVLVIAGDVSAEQGFALAERFFGDWPRPANPRPAQPDASASAPAPRAIVVDLPQSGQAAVFLGSRAVARRDADYFPTLVASTVLGGGFSARLNMEIRVRRGLSYGVGSGLQQRFAPAPLIASAQTRNDAASQVVELMEAEFNRLRATPVPETELTARKATLIGNFARSVETTSGVASQISTLALFGLPPERLNAYIADVGAVTPEQVSAAAARYFDPARADLVVVGDASLFYDALRRRRANAERIPIGELNLDRETLR